VVSFLDFFFWVWYKLCVSTFVETANAAAFSAFKKNLIDQIGEVKKQ
jgi:hypothetical protein